MRYYVFRSGWNTANQPSSYCEHTMRVAEVEAVDEDDALRLARRAGVTQYNGQGLGADLADEIDAKDAAEEAEIAEKVTLY
jgi:hypothetical protein